MAEKQVKEPKKQEKKAETIKKPLKESEKTVKKVAAEPKSETKEDSVKKIIKAPESKSTVKVLPSENQTKIADEPEVKKEPKPKEIKKASYSFKLFNKWDANVVVVDQGLRRYITLNPILVPFSQGRTVKKQFWKSEKHIVERLINKLMVTGHKGKKHYRSSGQNTGKYTRIAKVVQDAFDIIERKTKKNPLEVYIRALEHGSAREGVTTIEYGGVRYPKAVDLSPQRRIDLVLRWMCQGAYHAKAGKGKKVTIADTLAEQILLAAAGDQKSNAVQKKFELERSSSASR
jgi:small subunit ribosomal protein S7